MALSQARTVFGIHSISPVNVSTGLPYGTARVLGGSTFTLSGETTDLYGGSNPYPWQIENSTLSAEISMTFREYPDFGFEVFLGKSLTKNAAETGGSVTALTNKFGTSVLSASTGIDNVGIESGEEANLKFSKFVVKAVGADSVDVYAVTNLDFARGEDKVFEDDLLKITATPLTITASTAVSVPGFGVELTGGSGTIALVSGDTATFGTRPVNTGSAQANFGSSVDVFPEFSCYLYAQQQGSGRMFEIFIYKAKVLGMPIGMTANEFSEAEVTAKAFYDSSADKVFSIEEVII